jgi:hypothetical protein
VFRKGRLVRVEHRRSERLAIALLSGRDRGIDAYRRSALSKRQHREDLRALDAVRERHGEGSPEVWAEQQRIVDRLAGDLPAARDPEPARPRVRSL